jgi:hypothetical protein
VQVVQKYSLAHPRIKLQKKHLWVEGSYWGKGIELKIAKVYTHTQKNSFKFSQLPTKKHLNHICISICHVALPRKGKTFG